MDQMLQMTLKCSVCGGEVIQKNNNYICAKCGRSKTFKNGPNIKEIDLNDETKNCEQVLFG